MLLLPACDPPVARGGIDTVAALEVIRPAVEIRGSRGAAFLPTGPAERLLPDAEIRAGERARAVLRHDGGARLLLDGGAALRLDGPAVNLLAGRVWADVGPGAEVALSVPGFSLTAGGAGAAFELSLASGAPRVTVIRGEVGWRAAAPGEAQKDRGVVAAGMAAALSGAAQVTPVVLWDDWTGGLGWPDPRAGRGAAGVGEIGARRPGDLGEARFPLSIQRLQVRTRIEDDLAITTVEQTFFNPADATLEGIYRIRVPEGAILSRFAIDRRGRLVDGYVKEREAARKQYQAQVYEGSTHDPALLEWEAPGSYKARLYPLPPGSTRRVLVTYSEWLTPHGPDGGLRTYRYPMAGSGGDLSQRPLLQELDLEVDASRAGAKELRAGLGALVPEPKERRVVLRRTDFVPTADFLLELSGADDKEPGGARAADVARGYRAAHVLPPRPGDRGARRPEDDYVLVRALPVPTPDAKNSAREPLDLVLVVDVSAATDATHLALSRTMAESLLRHLSPDDRVTLLGADLDLHALGEGAGASGKKGRAALPSLQPANPDNIARLLGALGQVRTGGATDLGAVLGQAGALLDPQRLGGVVYLGDALPTVGELDLPALRERLERLPVPLRLYGVGVGAEADLGLLSGLCQESAGLSFRIADRAGAAESALQLLQHLSRPAAARLTVTAGPGVDRVYPRQPVSLVSGEVLPILARVRKGVPPVVTVSGVLRGQAFSRTFQVRERKLADTADLRLRWSAARLQQLLHSGASTEEVAELGVRQDLITPYTSFYVPSEDEITLYEQALPDLRAAGCSRSAQEAAPVAVLSEGGEEARGGARYHSDEGRMGHRAAAQAPMMDAPAKPVQPRPMPQAPAATATAMPSTPGAPPPPPSPEPDSDKKADSSKDYAPKREAKEQEAQKSAVADDQMNLAAPSAAPAEERARDRAEDPTSGKSLRAAVGRDGLLKNKAGDDLGAIGGLFGTQTGEAYGAAGLGLRGAGSGGGGYGAGNLGLPRTRAAVAAKRKAGKKGGHGTPVFIPDAVVSAPAPVDVSIQVNSGDTTVVVGILSHRPRGCSAASKLPLDDRADLWRERLAGASVRRALEVFQDAQQGCEIARFTDRRALLRLLLRAALASGGPAGMVQLYGHFGEDDEAQQFLRRAILGEVKTPRDLRVIYDGLGLGDEERVTLAREVVQKAKTPEERLRRLEELLQRWPGDLRLRLLLMESQELLGQAEAARRTAEAVRLDLYADAQARTAVGELLLRQGDEAGARRAFSEIVEFAPRDALSRRRLGDLYRAHGWYDEAYRQYQTLLTLLPGDLSVLLLQAAAAAGAGHLEEALGLEARVASTAEPGGEVGLPRTALWLSGLRLAELRQEARDKKDTEELARLLLRARRTGTLGLSRPVRVFLTWAHPEADLELRVAAPGEAAGSATQAAPELGLYGWDSSKDAPVGGDYRFEVRRGEGAGAALRYAAELVVLVGEGTPGERLYRKALVISAEQPLLRFGLTATGLEVQ